MSSNWSSTEFWHCCASLHCINDNLVWSECSCHYLIESMSASRMFLLNPEKKRNFFLKIFHCFLRYKIHLRYMNIKEWIITLVAHHLAWVESHLACVSSFIPKLLHIAWLKFSIFFAKIQVLNQQGSSMSHQQETVETYWNSWLNIFRNFDTQEIEDFISFVFVSTSVGENLEKMRNFYSS